VKGSRTHRILTSAATVIAAALVLAGCSGSATDGGVVAQPDNSVPWLWNIRPAL
jgi:PBP1b-binding outer membrane lipoprotein LpoB